MKAQLAAAILVGALCLLSTSSGFAGETPHGLWVRAKCALCHGDDGSGNTSAGKAKKVPDLRSEAVQKETDDELAKAVTAGHGSMPSFGAQLKSEQVATLVVYIRGLAPRK